MNTECPLSRRSFLRQGARLGTGVVAGGATACVLAEEASARSSSNEDLKARAAGQAALLFDGTLCVGCRSCELACNEKNELGRTTDEIFQGRPAEDARALAPNVFTYVTFHQIEADPSSAHFGKVQCMHCIEPACVSSCPVAALEKTAEGPVIWHDDLCLGCRYCMMACPFLVPRFEWGSANPRIRKCNMCYDLQSEGKKPACVEACPTGAIIFGKRDALLEEAYQRIEAKPRSYVHHVYGEEEAGGTSFLHLAARPFEDLGYRRDLPKRSYRDYTRPAMAAIPHVLTGLGFVLGAVAWVVNRYKRVDEREGGR